MILSHIVAASENHAIGIKNELLWHIPEDLKFFKEKTMGSIIIMGRLTYESVGQPLPRRTTIVVTRNLEKNQYPESVYVCKTISEAIQLGKKQGEIQGLDEIFIVGGGQIYSQSLDLVDRVYLTRIHVNLEGDTFYPEIPPTQFKLVSEKKSKYKDYEFSFLKFDRMGN